MQETVVHLTKRHQVMDLFHKEKYIDKNEIDGEWFPISTYPEHPVVMAKFSDESTEKVYFCPRYPYWLYFEPKQRPPVITNEITNWAYLK